MADIVLAKLDSEGKLYRIAPPLGILYLAGSLERAGYRVRLVHETGTPADIAALVDLVAREKPLFVGLSTLTGPPLRPTATAAREIKARCGVPTVWGGLHPTMLPEQTLANDFVDVVAIGEGEETILELAGVIRDHGLDPGKLSAVRGIGYKHNGATRLTAPRPFITNLDDYYPAWHLLDIERYFRHGRHFYTDTGSQFRGEKIAAVLTSRGCPWRCAFCYNQFVNQRRFRPLSVERVVGEIDDYKERFGVTGVVFEDDNLFGDQARALEIVRRIGVPWTSTIRANDLVRAGDDFARELSAHHCAELRIGAESGSQHILDIMQKDITVEQIREAVLMCLRHKIHAGMGFMVGIPGETWADVRATLDFIDEFDEYGSRVAVNGPWIFTPYPGTPLFDLAVEHGYVPPTSLDEWSTRIFDHKQALAPYADRRIRFIGYYRDRFCGDRTRRALSLPAALLRAVARWRWRRRFFSLPLDYSVPAFLMSVFARIGLGAVVERLRPERGEVRR
jgi:anaerobic magnesium-protoporphyrin IX monomethyl ester cyclase